MPFCYLRLLIGTAAGRGVLRDDLFSTRTTVTNLTGP